MQAIQSWHHDNASQWKKNQQLEVRDDVLFELKKGKLLPRCIGLLTIKVIYRLALPPTMPENHNAFRADTLIYDVLCSNRIRNTPITVTQTHGDNTKVSSNTAIKINVYVMTPATTTWELVRPLHTTRDRWRFPTIASRAGRRTDRTTKDAVEKLSHEQNILEVKSKWRRAGAEVKSTDRLS